MCHSIVEGGTNSFECEALQLIAQNGDLALIRSEIKFLLLENIPEKISLFESTTWRYRVLRTRIMNAEMTSRSATLALSVREQREL